MRTTGCGYMVVTLILAFLGLFARCLCMAQAISHTRQPEHLSGTTAILRRINCPLTPHKCGVHKHIRAFGLHDHCTREPVKNQGVTTICRPHKRLLPLSEFLDRDMTCCLSSGCQSESKSHRFYSNLSCASESKTGTPQDPSRSLALWPPTNRAQSAPIS